MFGVCRPLASHAGLAGRGSTNRLAAQMMMRARSHLPAASRLGGLSVVDLEFLGWLVDAEMVARVGRRGAGEGEALVGACPWRCAPAHCAPRRRGRRHMAPKTPDGKPTPLPEVYEVHWAWHDDDRCCRTSSNPARAGRGTRGAEPLTPTCRCCAAPASCCCCRRCCCCCSPLGRRVPLGAGSALIDDEPPTLVSQVFYFMLYFWAP